MERMRDVSLVSCTRREKLKVLTVRNTFFTGYTQCGKSDYYQEQNYESEIKLTPEHNERLSL